MEGNKLGCTSAIEHEIHITDSEPFKEQFRQMAPPPFLEKVCASLQDRLDARVIHPSQSPWCNVPTTRGGGKGKQPQQKSKPPPVQVQEDQYTFDDTNNYYHNENYRGQPRGHRPYRGQILDDFSEVKIHVVEVNAVKICTKANIRVTITKVIITKATMVYITTHIEIINKVTIMANLEAEAEVVAEVITMDIAMAGLIIKAITTINTISIMVMMMSTRWTNMAHHVHYAVAIIILPNIVLRESMTFNDIMEKMNIIGHQSQPSGLYSYRGA